MCSLQNFAILTIWVVRFVGTEAWVIGALPAGNVTYPKAVYTLDDGSSGEASPYEDSSGVTVYYSTPENLSPGNHTIFLNITSASNNSPFFFDALLFYPTDGSSIHSKNGFVLIFFQAPPRRYPGLAQPKRPSQAQPLFPKLL